MRMLIFVDSVEIIYRVEEFSQEDLVSEYNASDSTDN